MIEHVLVEQVRLIEKEDRVELLFAQVLDVGRHGVEERGCGRRRREAQGGAQLPVEVPATERGVVAVREPEAGRGQQPMAPVTVPGTVRKSLR